MLLVYLLSALVALATFIYYYITRTFNYWKDKGVVGPEPVPFFGNLKESATRKKSLGVVFKAIYDAYPNEKIVGIYRMTTPCLLIRDLDIIKHVLIKDFDLFIDRGKEFSKKGMGSNLFHADGETWRVLRNRFTPIFTTGKLKTMLYLIIDRADDFVKYVDEICSSQLDHEMYTLVQKYTVATISACAFGLDVDTQNNNETTETLQKIDKLIFNKSFAHELDMMYPGILKKFNGSLFPKFVGEFFVGLVEDVVKQRNGRPSNRNDFMDLILELRQQGQVYGTKRSEEEKQLSLELTDDVIAAQAFVFYAAGYETGATTMSFMLYELAKNHDIQEKLIADIDEVLKNHDGKLTYEALQNMKYLEKVFDETLRMYPLVEPLQRNVKADYRVPGTDVIINKGTTVLITPYGIHHDEKYFKEPAKFDPDREFPEHPCVYMPFGVGPRNCIGMRFAKVQSRVCMVKFLSKFRVKMSVNTPNTLELCPNRLILGPKDGIRLTIVRR